MFGKKKERIGLSMVIKLSIFAQHLYTFVKVHQTVNFKISSFDVYIKPQSKFFLNLKQIYNR